MSRPALSDLEIFVLVTRHRSFRKAAIERGVAPSRISQSVRQLERQLGLALLHRTTRSVTPTEAGEALVTRLAPVFGDIDVALDELNQFRNSPSGRLRINAPSPVAQLILAPMAADFLAAHPGVRLEITADDALVDVLSSGHDAGVRFSEDVALDMVSVPLPSLGRLVLVASPVWLARHGPIESPRQLRPEWLIPLRFPGGAIPSWTLAKEGESMEFAPAGPFVVNRSALAVRGAADGLGIACVFEGYVAGDVGRGELALVLEDWCPPYAEPRLYYPSRRRMPAALRAFVDYLAGARAAGTEARGQ